MSFPDDKLVGRLRRKHYLATFPEEVQQGWVPLKRTVQTFCLPKSAKSKTSIGVERCQFPIEFCAATTIFKYQGKSAKSLEINLSGYNFKGGAYTALTRCETRLGNSLISDLKPSHCQPSIEVKTEMQKLRSEKLYVPTLDLPSPSDNVLKLVFHNVESVRAHFPIIRSSLVFKNADMLSL